MSRTARRWIIVAVVAIVGIGALAAVLVVLGGVQVPDVTGKTQSEATKALEDAGLKAGAVTSTSDAEVPAGTVVRQDPAAGTEVDDGSAVSLVVSSGPGTAAVPDVVGMDRAEAEAVLADAGFVPASAMQYDLTAPAGQVVEQLPAAGEQVTAGSQVGMLVSKGRPEVSVSVPDVTGMKQDEATTALADAGLVTVPVEAYFADVPAGEVAEQEPAAGDRVSPLSEVLVTVSLGEGTTSVVVPDVIGQKQAKATSELEAAGLAVTVAKAWSPDVAEGVVIAQAPKAGVKVEKGGDAGILVSLGLLPSPSPTPSPSGSAAASPSPSAAPPSGGANPPEEPAELTAVVPDLAGMDVAQAEAALVELGLRPVPLEAASATALAGTVFEQLPAAGTEVPKTYPVLLLVSTGPQAQVNPLPAGE
jgi:eukaryotic-like serine/threonine-protein kinase